jgi:hypothetical protein
VQRVHATTGASTGELRFLDAAFDTVVAGRQTCAWSYAHAYCEAERAAASPSSVAGAAAAAAYLALLTALQADVEGYVEMLAERVRPSALQALVDDPAAGAAQRLADFRVRVTELTAAVRGALHSLVAGADDGFDVR